MTGLDTAYARLSALIETGGPVIAIILAISVATLGVVIYKIWQFRASGVGRHHALRAAMTAWDRGDAPAAHRSLDTSHSYLAPVIARAFGQTAMPDTAERHRIEAEAELRFSRLERGFRFLDMVAQVTPLLGLFGTVLGMIEAFQALQSAGSQVDPSLLAGGIWVALLTTAAGLAVAMPASVVLSWFDSRMAEERALADHALSVALRPYKRGAAMAAPSGDMVPQSA